MSFKKNFGTFQRDKLKNPINVANAILTKDASTVAQTSPLTVSSTEIDIVIPENAIEMYLFVSGSYDVIISEVTGMARNCKCPAGSEKELPLGRVHHLFVKLAGATSDSEISFYFKTI
jgi:hypothetical protein